MHLDCGARSVYIETVSTKRQRLMTSEAIDIHVLVDRSRETVERAFAMPEVSKPALNEPVDLWLYGQTMADTGRNWPNAWQAADDALADPNLGFSIYVGPMIGFTTDGLLTVGLTVDLDYSPYELGDEPLSPADRARVQGELMDLASQFGARLGIAAWEQPPPESEREMRRLMASAEVAFELTD